MEIQRSAETTAPYELGLDYVGQGRWDDAVRALREVLRLDAFHVPGLSLLAYSLAQADRQSEALEAYRQLAALCPEVAPAHVELGQYLRRLGRREEALASFQRASELEPGNADIMYDLGELHALLRHDDRAMRCYEEVLKRNPQHGMAHFGLGLAFWNKGNLEAAERVYRAGLALEPGYGYGWYLLAGVVATARDEAAARPELERAVETLRRQLSEQPRNGLLFCVLGASLAGLGRIEDAAAAFDKGLEVQPDCLDELPELRPVFEATKGGGPSGRTTSS